ncbi:MAG: glutathione S-transferase family protein [Micropepsaceae bacterium]
MADLKIYGYAGSRAVRNLWMCEELGLGYDHIAMTTADGATRTPEFLEVNPAGHIPAMDDGGFKLSESLAINLYLAKKHQRLCPQSLQDEARAWQWSLWAASELDAPIFQWIVNSVILPVERRNAGLALQAREALEWPLTVINRELASREFLIPGTDFSVADLNVASVMYRLLAVDLDSKPYLKCWLTKCWGRPAAKKARAMREG